MTKNNAPITAREFSAIGNILNATNAANCEDGMVSVHLPRRSANGLGVYRGLQRLAGPEGEELQLTQSRENLSVAASPSVWQSISNQYDFFALTL